jgi:hypothetical protein
MAWAERGLRAVERGPLLLLLGLLLVSGCRTMPEPGPIVERRAFTLAPGAVWQIELPDGKPADPSALLTAPEGGLFTLNDKEAALYRLIAPRGEPVAHLARVPGFFATEQLASFRGEKRDRYDVEGLARDAQGRIYVSEEANRWVLRFSPDGSRMERLPIDWSPVARFFDPKDWNASFEGVAVIGRTLFVANERSLPRIVRVDLDSMRVTGDFSPTFHVPLVNEAHYSDLSVWRGNLFVLVRSRAQILEVDPRTEQVVAEYDASFAEKEPEFAYITRYGTGNLEGLAIDADGFWLVTDNNGLGRKRYPDDPRPTLFFCPWPEGARTKLRP